MSDGTPGDEMSATRQPGDSLTVQSALAGLVPVLVLILGGDAALWLDAIAGVGAIAALAGVLLGRLRVGDLRVPGWLAGLVAAVQR